MTGKKIKRRRRLKRIADAQEYLESSLLELRKHIPELSNAAFKRAYYVIRLARKAP